VSAASTLHADAFRWLRDRGLDRDDRPGIAKIKHVLRESERRAKDAVIEALDAFDIGVNDAARAFGCDESTVRGWRDNVKKHPRLAAVFDLPEGARLFVIERLVDTLSEEKQGELVRGIIRKGEK
jgi:hypothetical protein